MDKDLEFLEDNTTSWGKGKGYSVLSPNGDNRVENHASHDDIIELVDVVREGLPLTDADDISVLMEEGQGGETDGDHLEKGIEESEGGFFVSLENAPDTDPTSRLDTLDAAPHDRLESPDFDFETSDSFEPLEDDGPDISQDDLDLVMTDMAYAEAAGEPYEMATRDEEPLSISQERLESAIAGAIQPVVERVVREAVAEVAERVIREAIESLRQSIETTPE